MKELEGNTCGSTHNRSLRGLRQTIKLNDVETAPMKPARVTKKSNLKRKLQFSLNWEIQQELLFGSILVFLTRISNKLVSVILNLNITSLISNALLRYKQIN